jgi:hypothetical protein
MLTKIPLYTYASLVKPTDFYFNSFRQCKLRFSVEWHSYLHLWIWMNHVGGRWNNIYSSKLGTFIQKWSNTISRFGSILAISSTLKLGIYLWNFPLYRFWAINHPKKNAAQASCLPIRSKLPFCGAYHCLHLVWTIIVCVPSSVPH